MRMTINIGEDILDKARKTAERRGSPLHRVVNDALRIGLAKIEKQPMKKPYRTVPHDMGLQLGFSLDNVQETLSQSEG